MDLGFCYERLLKVPRILLPIHLLLPRIHYIDTRMSRFLISLRCLCGQIGQIFQKFECGGESNGGVVRNIVKWSIPNILEVTFCRFNFVHLCKREGSFHGIFLREHIYALLRHASKIYRSYCSILLLGNQWIIKFRFYYIVLIPSHARWWQNMKSKGSLCTNF